MVDSKPDYDAMCKRPAADRICANPLSRDQEMMLRRLSKDEVIAFDPHDYTTKELLEKNLVAVVEQRKYIVLTSKGSGWVKRMSLVEFDDWRWRRKPGGFW